MIRMILVTAFMSRLVFVAHAEDTGNSAEQACAKIHNTILSNSKSVLRGNVLVRTQYEAIKPEPSRHTSTIRILFDGNKMRGETSSPYAAVDKPQHRTHYTDLSCYGCYDGKHVSYSDRYDNPDDRRRFALTIADLSSVSKYASYVPDPRWIGKLPTSVLGQMNVEPEAVFCGDDALECEVTRQEVDGQNLIRATWHIPNAVRTRYTVWLDESKSDLIVMISGQLNYHGIEVECVAKSTSIWLPNTKLWWPEKISYERRENGNLVEKEDATIEVDALNEPLDVQIFTLDGIKAPNGTPVVWASEDPRPSNGESLVWTGDKIVNQIEAPVSSGTPNGNGHRSKRWLIYANLAILFIGVSAYFLHRMFVSRRV